MATTLMVLPLLQTSEVPQKFPVHVTHTEVNWGFGVTESHRTVAHEEAWAAGAANAETPRPKLATAMMELSSFIFLMKISLEAVMNPVEVCDAPFVDLSTPSAAT